VISQPVSTSDHHTAGGPFRIVAGTPVLLRGDSVADRRARALGSPEALGLRQLLCSEPLLHESIADRSTGAVVAASTISGRPAVVPRVTGLAHRTGEHTFLVDPADPLVPGFVLR
jgi:proline racemase